MPGSHMGAWPAALGTFTGQAAPQLRGLLMWAPASGCPCPWQQGTAAHRLEALTRPPAPGRTDPVTFHLAVMQLQAAYAECACTSA